MKLYLDTTRAILSANATGAQPLARLDAKRGDQLLIEIMPSTELATGATGVLVAKPKGVYTGDPVALDSAWEAPAEAGAGYTFLLDLNTEEIDALFTGETASVELMAELTWTASGRTRSTQTFALVVARDVWRGDEGAPLTSTALAETPNTVLGRDSSGSWIQRTASQLATFLNSVIAPAWANITGKPSTFAPASHTHPATDISDATPAGRAMLTAADAAAQAALLPAAGPGVAKGMITLGSQTIAGEKTFTDTLTANGDIYANGNTTLGDASGDSVLINAGTVNAPNATSTNPNNLANVGALATLFDRFYVNLTQAGDNQAVAHEALKLYQVYAQNAFSNMHTCSVPSRFTHFRVNLVWGWITVPLTDNFPVYVRFDDALKNSTNTAETLHAARYGATIYPDSSAGLPGTLVKVGDGPSGGSRYRFSTGWIAIPTEWKTRADVPGFYSFMGVAVANLSGGSLTDAYNINHPFLGLVEFGIQ